METRQLYKQGSSLVLVIPTKYAATLGWSAKDIITLTINPDFSVTLRKNQPLKQEQLPLSSITNQNPEHIIT